MKVACEGSIPDWAKMRRMVTSCNPPREEIPINFPFKSAIEPISGVPTRSSSTRSTKHMTTRVLMPRMFATTPAVIVVAYWMSPARSTLMLRAAGMSTISTFSPSF